MANTAVTLPSARKSVLSNQERAQGFTHKYKVLFTDVDEGGGTAERNRRRLSLSHSGDAVEVRNEGALTKG